VKSTPIGMLWDEQFPWIYHVELSGWCYVLPQDTYTGGYYAWRANIASWAWLPAAWPGWYYDYASAGWKQMN
ncbi:MAG TPA: hypothetical protein VK995_01475, partial [Oceanipulchritudo sp.]|nr:hypothetical protein [Oceanipulchritudo sp.]